MKQIIQTDSITNAMAVAGHLQYIEITQNSAEFVAKGKEVLVFGDITTTELFWLYRISEAWEAGYKNGFNEQFS